VLPKNILTFSIEAFAFLLDEVAKLLGHVESPVLVIT
jgi:hypothetical protein